MRPTITAGINKERRQTSMLRY